MRDHRDATGPATRSSVEVAARDGATVLILSGELDLEMATPVRLRFDELKGDVEADCAGVTFMDCSGVNVMIEMNQQCHARSAKLTVVNPPPCVTRLLSLTRLDGVLDIRSRVPGG